ncbi:MAG: carbohydrate kinase family protein [Patescibacteria group bacterium]
MRYDLISFGDITIDAFIRLKDARVNCDINDENCMLCVKFGQKIPFESVTEVFAVGNGPNAAVSALRLGLNATLVANVGNDRNGIDCIETLKKEGMNPEYIRAHDGIKTNYHYVLQYEAERTILVKHEEYPYALPQFAEAPKWFYLTSLPEQTLDYQLEIARYAKQNGVKLAFQPGTFQLKLGKEKLAEVYQASDIVFCNKEESQLILGTPDEHDLKKLLSGIRSLGPKIAVITDGRNGSYIMDDSGLPGQGAWHIPMYPDPAPPVSRTGAGDATASTTVAYLIKGLASHEALMRGVINAAFVVQKVGAQTGLLHADEVEAAYKKRPAEFVTTPL